MEIDKWEQDLKTRPVSPDEINEQFDSLFKTTGDLAQEAILANIELSVCGQISYYKTSLQRIKRNALINLELHESMNSLPLNPRMEDRIRDEIDLSIGNRFKNRLQILDHNNQVRNTINLLLSYLLYLQRTFGPLISQLFWGSLKSSFIHPNHLELE